MPESSILINCYELSGLIFLQYMDTALFYYGYSDRTPNAWHLAVSKDSGKSRFKIDYPFVRPYFVEPDLPNLGLTSGETDSNPVRIYDKERTICDCLRYRNKMDREIFVKAIQRFVNDTSKKHSPDDELCKKTEGSQYGEKPCGDMALMAVCPLRGRGFVSTPSWTEFLIIFFL